MDTKKLLKHVPWALLGILSAFCLAVVALRRGEHVSALWIVVASVSVYLVAYRYYSLYIAQKVMKLDPTRATPAVINNDGLNYVPTNRYVLFGHHFAAIAGAGPLVEMFSDRLEITNPGQPLVQPERFLDFPPRSRNEALDRKSVV